MTTANQEMVRQREEQLEQRTEPVVTPLVDVYENNDEILLYVDVPGVAEDGLDVRLDNGQIDIVARQAPPKDGLAYDAVTFKRTFTVPSTVDPAKVAAKLDGGVLKLHLHKSEAAKPRRIAVTTG